MYEVLICDLDGTLVDLGIDWDSLRSRIRRLLKTDHPLKPLGPSIPVAAKHDKRLIEKAFNIVESVEVEAAENAKANPELLSLISNLKSKGVRFCIVTLQSRSSAEKVVSKMGLDKYLDLLVTRDYTLDRVEQLKLVLETLKIEDLSKVLFVGDTELDLESGEKLGLKTIILGRRYKDVCEVIREFWRNLI